MKNFIQWKGTNVCIDIHCPNCEFHSHFDGDFLYHFKCPKCLKVFAMGTEVSMKEYDGPNNPKTVEICSKCDSQTLGLRNNIPTCLECGEKVSEK